MALITSGPFSQVPNLMEIFRGFFEFQGANIVGLVSDECGNSADLDQLLDQLMTRLMNATLSSVTQPQTFLGVGGMKIFRDDIYGRLRLVFAADHRAYRQLGFYKTFPQAEFDIALLNTFISPVVNLPPIRQKFDAMVKEQMILPLKNVVRKA